MFRLSGIKLKLPRDQETWEFVRDVSAAVAAPPLLLTMLEAGNTVVGVEQEPSLSWLGGPLTRPFDLLLGDTACIVVLAMGMGHFDLWEFRVHSASSLLDHAIASLGPDVVVRAKMESPDDLVSDLKMSISREERSRAYHSPTATAIDWKSPAADEASSLAATTLANRACRLAALELRKSARLPTASLQPIDSGLLIKAQLAQTRSQIRCRKDSRVLAITDDVSTLTATSARCQCGRPYRDELIEPILEVGPTAALLSQSKWMLQWLSERAQACGVRAAEIGWNAVRGDDELDMCIRLPGMVAFAEFKDRDFGLGDLYPFLVRLDRYGGEIGLVCATGRVDEQVLEFAKSQSRFPPLILIPDVDTNPSEFDRAVGEMQAMAFSRLMTRISHGRGLSIPIGHFLHSWHQRIAAPKSAIA